MFDYLTTRYSNAKSATEEAKAVLLWYGVDVNFYKTNVELDEAIKESLNCAKIDDIDYFAITTALRMLGYKPTKEIGSIKFSTEKLGEFDKGWYLVECYTDSDGTFYKVLHWDGGIFEGMLPFVKFKKWAKIKD